MKAIIIGAGQGIHLMPETEGIPKCMMDGMGGTACAREEHGREKR